MRADVRGRTVVDSDGEEIGTVEVPSPPTEEMASPLWPRGLRADQVSTRRVS
jgi:hypothetical protein